MSRVTIFNQAFSNPVIRKQTWDKKCIKIKIIDGESLAVTDEIKRDLANSFLDGTIAIVASTSLSDETIENNLCCKVLGIEHEGKDVYALVEPVGPKARIARYLFETSFLYRVSIKLIGIRISPSSPILKEIKHAKLEVLIR